MFKFTKQFLKSAALVALMMWLSTAATLKAQIVTNGGFESSSVGVVDTTAVKGWLIQVADTAKPQPVFQIVSDTVEQGNRALEVTVQSVTTGANAWDIQIVADSIHVKPGVTYNYSIWAKSAKAGATVNFTMGNYSYTEYKHDDGVVLTTQWQKYTMQFIVNDGQTWIRGPIHFDFAANVNNTIYIDNLQIGIQMWAIDRLSWKQNPVILEANSRFYRMAASLMLLQIATGQASPAQAIRAE